MSLRSKFKSSELRKRASFPTFKYAAVILAAGESKRFGSPKQLLKLGGKSLLEIALDLVGGADFFSKRIVVLGAYLIEILKSVRFPLEVLKVYNPHYKRGIGSSVSLAVRCLRGCDAVFFLPIDQPLLTQRTLFLIKEAFESGRWSIVAPQKGGLPTLFSMKWRRELIRLGGDEGGRSIIKKYPQEVGRVEIPSGELFDIDRPEDLILLSKGRFQR
ncbi:MAG: nucleotidyltransferase family protein [Synergistetes bacterium]|nr:nucleotidyltransferase family protein [Synergistota bacterium]